MKIAAVRHFPFYPFMQALARTKVRFILEAAADDLTACELVWWNRDDPDTRFQMSMTQRAEDGQNVQWQCEISASNEIHYIKYGFFLTSADGEKHWYNAYGLWPDVTVEGSFEILQINPTDVLRVPEWAQGCVWYQIFPERFARSQKQNTTVSSDISFDRWDAQPNRENYLGGNLAGIAEHLEYLAELGIECIYLNPVFLGDFNHKYATTDYRRVDPLFGMNDDLITLVDKAHRLDIRVVLDGVFNHCGIHFPPFADLMRNGECSAYKNWFYPKHFPISITADCYECVGNYPYMPRLNGADPAVRAFVLDVLLYWLETAHIDGWRFDVADELDRHAVAFWREEVKKKYPDAVMLAETWSSARRMLGPDGFDCAMNYLFRDAMIDFFAHGAISAQCLRKRLNAMLMLYTDEANAAMYNLIGSHDTARFLTEANGEKRRLRLAMAFQMLFPGAPAIYYGDEMGMMGANDPGCRGGMTWEGGDSELLAWQKQLIALRKDHPAIRKGTYTVLKAEDCLFAFAREHGADRVIAVFNAGSQPITADFAEAAGSVDVPAFSVKIIFPFTHE